MCASCVCMLLWARQRETSTGCSAARIKRLMETSPPAWKATCSWSCWSEWGQHGSSTCCSTAEIDCMNKNELSWLKPDVLVSVLICRGTEKELFMLSQAETNCLCKVELNRLEKTSPSACWQKNCSVGALTVAPQLEFLFCAKAISAGQNAICSRACWSETWQAKRSTGCCTAEMNCLYKNWPNGLEVNVAASLLIKTRTVWELYQFSIYLVASNDY